MAVKSVTKWSELQTLISSGDALAVDCYATWCGPCQMISPRFEAFSGSYPNIHFVKVNVDEAQEIATELGIASLPTFLFYKDGKKVSMFLGADVSRLEAALNSVA